MTDPNRSTIFIDPFSDWTFKRLFGSNESKPMRRLDLLINGVDEERTHRLLVSG